MAFKNSFVRKPIAVGVAALFALTAVACGDDDDGADSASGSPSESSEDLVEVRALLSFMRVPAFYPALVAEQLGYFAEEGMSVSWEPTDGSAFDVQQIAAGNADVAIVISEPAILGYAQSPNFQIIYNLANETVGHLNDTWALASGGIESEVDLADQSIGVKDAADGAVPGLRASLEMQGLTEGSDYELVPLGESPAAQATALIDGDVAAFRGSRIALVGLREAVESAGDELVCISCDTDTRLSSLVVIASNEFIEEHPDLTEGLGRALARGTVFGTENPERAVELLMEADPETNTDPDLTDSQLQDTIEQFTLGDPPSDQYGFSTAEGVENTMDLLLVPGLDSGLEEPIDVDSFVNNDFVDAYNDFDPEEVA